MDTISEKFGSLVFNDRVMKERLSTEVYNSLKRTIEEQTQLDISIAKEVANAIKEWAIEKGATHFTHWFQPLTGITAEKHDSFITPSKDGRIIIDFSAKELLKGEPDASSFPNGGLRATFEARGYTAWDPSSYAFIKDKVLYIPTVFCSYGGEALDKKTPLLRSIEVINKQALRILRLFGNQKVRFIKPMVGIEQEYFLIDKDVFNKRKDIKITGRTLFGANPPKGQEMDDHYFGVIKPRIKAFMEDLNDKLWKLGIMAKTEHNEVAPSQYELAIIYTTTNLALDQNQLTMEIMQEIALKHNLVCLLHEKPFAGVNGSGKHNNYSLISDEGVNLFNPGETPSENAQFLLFICAVIKAVDEYQDLLRISVASASNDHRLGANEAPPAVISIFLGEELTNILKAIENNEEYNQVKKVTLKLGVDILPIILKDSTDRNRTSPFAFTGNKFEFRMLGSSNSIACANIMLNSAVAESLKIYADKLENTSNFNQTLYEIIKDTIKQHKRIIFNGNGYDEIWIKEASEKRGLSNYHSTPDCIMHALDPKNKNMLISQNIFSESELKSRCKIMLENYCKTIIIEANTMIDMTKKEILPSLEKYIDKLSSVALNKLNFIANISCEFEKKLIKKLTYLVDEIDLKVNEILNELVKIKFIDNVEKESYEIKDNLLNKINELRILVDEAEQNCAKEYWPYPTYEELLFSVN